MNGKGIPPSTTAGDLHVQDELLPDLKGRHILLIDDILDTGKTLKHLVEHLKGLGIASLRTAVLLRKEGRQELHIEHAGCLYRLRITRNGKLILTK